MALSYNKSLPWDEVERQISKEINWLEGTIVTFHKEERNAPIQCKQCLLRRIAVLITSFPFKFLDIKTTSS